MAYISKKTRDTVWKKYDCKCAYCGKSLTYKQMQVDHIEPHWHKMSDEDCEKHGIQKGAHELENFNPSCARCNRWKSTFTLEQFRHQISQQTKRLMRDSSNYRMAVDYGMVKETNIDIVFFFEKKQDAL